MAAQVTQWLTHWGARLGAYVLIVIVGVVGFVRISHVARRNCEQIEALKAIPFAEKTALIQSTRAFLKSHPGGIPGFSAREIQRNIDRMVLVRSQYAPKPCP